MDDISTTGAVALAAKEDGQLSYQDFLLGCGLAIAGNLMISVSLNVQKYTHKKNDSREVERHYTQDPLWWLGLFLMVFGEVGNFSAYGFAPASLVAPLGTTTVVANLFLAAIFLKESIKPEHLFGSFLAVVGAVLLVFFSSRSDKVLNGQQITSSLSEVSFIVYVCIELLILTVLFVLLYKFQVKHAIVYLLITSITASFTVISAKAVSSLLQLSMAGKNQFNYAIFYIMMLVMLATAVVQIKYLNQAMRKFDATVVVPTNFVFFTISAIIAGIVFYKEFWGMKAMEICMFLLGCTFCFIGVYFITAGRSSMTGIKKGISEDQITHPVTANVVPSWLLASMNVGQVQPTAELTHLMDADRMEDQKSISVSSSYSDKIVALNDSLKVAEETSKTYGATE